MIAKHPRPIQRSVNGDSDQIAVLECVSAQTYRGVAQALKPRRIQPSFHRGQLALPSRIESVSWKAYKQFLAAWGDQHVRHIYDQGLLEIMSPLKSHDWIKRLISRFIEAMSLDLRIEIQSIGSTTITSDLAERGFEPDEGYYIASEPKVRGKMDFEPDVDPPPDLIIEIDVTSSSQSRFSLFAAMKVPEIWRHDAKDLTFFVRSRSGTYRESPRSKAFPFLEPSDITRFLALHGTMSENDLVRRFVRWARCKNKIPREQR
jgi:Uma2 family endonuclease